MRSTLPGMAIRARFERGTSKGERKSQELKKGPDACQFIRYGKALWCSLEHHENIMAWFGQRKLRRPRGKVMGGATGYPQNLPALFTTGKYLYTSCEPTTAVT